MKNKINVTRRRVLKGAATVGGLGAVTGTAASHAGRQPGVAHTESSKLHVGHLQVNKGQGYIRARVFNKSDSSISLITVRAIIFDKSGDAVAHRTKWLTPSLDPNESTFVKIDYNDNDLHNGHMTVNHIF